MTDSRAVPRSNSRWLSAAWLKIAAAVAPLSCVAGFVIAFFAAFGSSEPDSAGMSGAAWAAIGVPAAAMVLLVLAFVFTPDESGSGRMKAPVALCCSVGSLLLGALVILVAVREYA